MALRARSGRQSHGTLVAQPLVALMASATEEVLCVGHTGWPLAHATASLDVLNDVGMPLVSTQAWASAGQYKPRCLALSSPARVGEGQRDHPEGH